MKSSVKVLVTALAVASAALATSAQAQYYGGGSTYQVPRQYQYQQPYQAPKYYDPTQSYTYKFVEKITPYVGYARNCAFGAVTGGLTGGYPGIVAGCGLAATGNSLFSPKQAY